MSGKMESMGGVMKAGAIVFGVQGFIVAGGSTYVCADGGHTLQIEPTLRDEFIFLLRASGVMLGATFCMKIWGTPFWEFQRYECAKL